MKIRLFPILTNLTTDEFEEVEDCAGKLLDEDNKRMDNKYKRISDKKCRSRKTRKKNE